MGHKIISMIDAALGCEISIPTLQGNEKIKVEAGSQPNTKNRVRILEGRHRRLKEKAELLRGELEKSPVGIDRYLEEWRRHSLESAEREIAWLEDMIKTERK